MKAVNVPITTYCGRICQCCSFCWFCKRRKKILFQIVFTKRKRNRHRQPSRKSHFAAKGLDKGAPNLCLVLPPIDTLPYLLLLLLLHPSLFISIVCKTKTRARNFIFMIVVREKVKRWKKRFFYKLYRSCVCVRGGKTTSCFSK